MSIVAHYCGLMAPWMWISVSRCGGGTTIPPFGESWQHVHPRTARSEIVTLVTYNSSMLDVAPCITTEKISYSALIRLMKLGTSWHHLNACTTQGPAFPDHAAGHVPGAAPLEPCITSWGTPECSAEHFTLECPHHSQTRLRYPTLFGPGTETRDMRTLLTDERMAAPLAAPFVHSLPAVTNC
jgi:hypothetical protein